MIETTVEELEDPTWEGRYKHVTKYTGQESAREALSEVCDMLGTVEDLFDVGPSLAAHIAEIESTGRAGLKGSTFTCSITDNNPRRYQVSMGSEPPAETDDELMRRALRVARGILPDN